MNIPMIHMRIGIKCSRSLFIQLLSRELHFIHTMIMWANSFYGYIMMTSINIIQMKHEQLHLYT